MKIQIQETCSVVNCSKEEVFSYHTDLNNLVKSLPFFLEAKINKLTYPIEKNDEFEICLFLFFIPFLKWKGKFLEFEKPDYFIDSKIENSSMSFFKNFQHEHRFSSEEHAVRITDTITLETFILLVPFIKIIFSIFLKMKFIKTRQNLYKRS